MMSGGRSAPSAQAAQAQETGIPRAVGEELECMRTEIVRAGLALDHEAAIDLLTFSLAAQLGPVNTYLSASKMSTKWMKPMNITSSFSNRENIRR